MKITGFRVVTFALSLIVAVPYTLAQQQPAEQNQPYPTAPIVDRFLQVYAKRHPINLGDGVAPGNRPAQSVNDRAPNRASTLLPRIVTRQPLCAIPLLNVPIDKNKALSIQQIVPAESDPAAVVKPAVPSCDHK